MKEKEAVSNPQFNQNDYSLNWGDRIEGEHYLDSIDKEDISTYSQAAHKRDIAGYDLSQNALCFEVLGGISLIVGILFIFLSLKKRRNTIIGINFASLQFVICVICLLAAIVLLTIGTINLVKSQKIRKAAKKDIAYLASLSRK